MQIGRTDCGVVAKGTIDAPVFGGRAFKHAQIARISLRRRTVVATPLSPWASCGGSRFSYPYTVQDGYGAMYNVMAMVQNDPYSDHIFVYEFWLNISRADSSQPPAVCSQYWFARNAPTPITGKRYNDQSPFPIYDNPTWDIMPFYQNMYWGSSAPVQIQFETDSHDDCGSTGGFTSAGVQMFRDASGWYDQGMTH